MNREGVPPLVEMVGRRQRKVSARQRRSSLLVWSPTVTFDESLRRSRWTIIDVDVKLARRMGQSTVALLAEMGVGKRGV